MHLSEQDARAALYCVADMLRRRQIGGIPVPQWLRDAHRALSVPGQEGEGPQLDSAPSDLIDTREAATMLDCHPRTIRRIAADLDGQIVAGRWCFSRSAVAEYAQSREENDVRSA